MSNEKQTALKVALELDDMDYPKTPNQTDTFFRLAKKLAGKVIRNDE